MGSIVTFNNPEDWFIEKEFENSVIVIVWEIDDYKPESLRKQIPKNVYNGLLSGEYNGKRGRREYLIYDKYDKLCYRL